MPPNAEEEIEKLKAEVASEDRSAIERLRDTARKVRVIKDSIDEYKAKADALKGEYDGHRDVLSGFMRELGMQKYEFKGVGLFYMSKVGHVKTCVSMESFAQAFVEILGLDRKVDEIEEELMKDRAFRRRVATTYACDLISSSVKESDLKAWYNELLESNEELAKQFEPVLNVFVEHRLNIRNSKGEKDGD